jgi:magnesium transporter
VANGDNHLMADEPAFGTKELELKQAPDALLGTAAEHASRHVPEAIPGQSAGEVRRGLIGIAFTTANAVAVLDGDQFVGVVPLATLLAAPEEALIERLVEPGLPMIDPEADQRIVAREMADRRVSALPVVDSEGRFLGLIPPHRMLRVLLEEHSEDLARIGGFLHGSRRARHAAEERVGLRIWHRLPWLLIGLLGAMASVALVSGFERQLDEKVLIAFFLPAVVYMADAVGTQTEALVIRALATRVSWARVVRRELLSGAVIGLLVGALFMPFALVGWGDGRVALAVGISLTMACATATAIAMALPFALQRLGFDPAFGSGPLATVAQDLVSIAVYLVVAVAIAA